LRRVGGDDFGIILPEADLETERIAAASPTRSIA
jgi:GGDEF domain-containing protein